MRKPRPPAAPWRLQMDPTRHFTGFQLQYNLIEFRQVERHSVDDAI